MDEGSGVAKGKAGGATGGGVDNGRPCRRLPGRLPFIKGVYSACLPQTPAGGVRCWNRGDRGDRGSAGVSYLGGARAMPGGEETLDLPAWNCALDQVWDPHHRSVLPRGATSCDLLGSSVISFRDCPSCGVPAPTPGPGSASCLRLAAA